MNKYSILLALGGYLLAGIHAMYMIFLRAPAVAEVRPDLVTVTFWTALFSGRFNSWLYYHYPVVGTVFSFVVITIILAVAWVFFR